MPAARGKTKQIKRLMKSILCVHDYGPENIQEKPRYDPSHLPQLFLEILTEIFLNCWELSTVIRLQVSFCKIFGKYFVEDKKM